MTSRHFLKQEITVEELREVVNELTHRQVRKAASRILHQAEFDDIASDLILHDGDLRLEDLRTGVQPFIGLLVVRGNLTVNGLFRDSLDPDSAVVVTGDLRVQRLVSEGGLEVHGSVVVEREALWIGSDGCAQISGSLEAALLYTSYHPVKVGGRVVAPVILGDSNRFESPSEFVFMRDTDPRVADLLPKSALSIEGDPWSIDHVYDEQLVKLVTEGTPLLQKR